MFNIFNNNYQLCLKFFAQNYINLFNWAFINVNLFLHISSNFNKIKLQILLFLCVKYLIFNLFCNMYIHIFILCLNIFSFIQLHIHLQFAQTAVILQHVAYPWYFYSFSHTLSATHSKKNRSQKFGYLQQLSENGNNKKKNTIRILIWFIFKLFRIFFGFSVCFYF